MSRIGFADHLFLRMHHGIGVPVFNQFLWWFDAEVPVERLESLHSGLSRGLLSRRVVGPVIPTARHRWIASESSLPLEVIREPIATETVRTWAEERIGSHLDPEKGTGWQLASVRTSDGGTVVSLVCSHMVADGAAMVDAVRRANRADEHADALSALGTAPPSARAVIDDLRDSIDQLVPIGRWGAATIASAIRPWFGGAPAVCSVKAGVPRRSEPAESSESTESRAWHPPYVVVDCSAAQWNATAKEWGGTSNSLFIGVLTAVTDIAGRAEPGDELCWSLPFSARSMEDTSSNSTKIVPVRVPVADDGDLDLTRIRASSKAAFTAFAARQASAPSDGGIPQQLIQLLPDTLVARLPRPADGAEGLCSNLGVLPDDFVSFGDFRARSVAARATFAGADADFARSLGGGTTAWISQTDESVTISFHGMDPDRFTSDEHLRGIVGDALDRWGLDFSFW